MLFPIIKIVDNGLDNKEPRVVGANSHDVLMVDEKTGGIQYLNLQCCEGTEKHNGESAYSFIGKSNEWLPRATIEFVTFETLAQIYVEQTKMSCEQEKRLREFIKKVADERESLIKENSLDKDDGVRHTGGTLI